MTRSDLIWRALLLLAVGVQFVVLYLPRVSTPSTGLPLDKVVHVAIFAAVGALGVLAGVPLRWLIGLLVLQAVASEVIQGWLLSNRSGDWADLVADLLGIALGVGGAYWWRSTRAPGAH